MAWPSRNGERYRELGRRELFRRASKSMDAAIPEQRSPARSGGEVLERLRRARSAWDAAEAELDALVERAVDLGIGWPEIAAELGVSRRAARQRYYRRHGSW
jgi:hypothetical protein